MWYEYLWLKLRKVARCERTNCSLATKNSLIFPLRRKIAQRQIIQILIIAFLLPLLFFIVPAWGQSTATNNNFKTAPVVLNGKILFKVSGNDDKNLTATKRAEIISSTLENILSSGESIEVDIDQKNEETILGVNSKYLLTVTATDVKGRMKIEEQAVIWKYRIEEALELAQTERQPRYIFQVLIISIILILTAFTLQLSYGFFEFKISNLFEERYPKLVNYFPTLLPLTGIAVRVIVWIVVVLYITDLIPFLSNYRDKVLNILKESFTSTIFNLGNKGFSILDIMFLVGLTIAMWKGVGYFISIFRSKIIGLTGAEQSIQDTISFLVQYGLIFLGILIILQLWGVDVSSLAIIASVLGVGIGFGLQNIANNFMSGIILIFERPIQVGDFIQVGNLEGIVKRIGLRSTYITTLDKISLIVPNSRFLENEVLNWSHNNPISRVKVPIGVAYGSEIRLVRKAILEVAKSHPEVLLHPSPQLWFQEFGDSSLNFDLLVWIREPQKKSKLKSELNYRIEVSLRKYGIEIPFPQRDLHLKSPEIEQMIQTWIQKNTTQSAELYYPDSFVHKLERKISDLELDEEDNLTVSTINNIDSEILNNIDIDTLIQEMRGSHGVAIKDRRHRWGIYPKCFVGSEAVKWLMRTQNLNLQEAISIGQLLINRGLIHHVLDRHDFKNEYLFYSFYEEE
ncbi:MULTISPECIES: mechanosensitive ion channel domain-containing protein [unclassified Okeania]|uniref:mechanosensitive ion channel domain-containing protein n=1 Tax=unclassified Okeania TaxID=2634635 RepID=UPI0013BA57E1|nr:MULTISPECIES: mechanosensitive ion channel domain-containing protein [unclassified Okeania]NES77626.1 mechanosensitive ion channel [Okeania sp. SIO1H4]NET21254.1 mechanosensitive ion channel [Okeania sp. SIO1H5]NET92669.1 mechanosensitive ion channel [Okeania sp. SIO1H2]